MAIKITEVTPMFARQLQVRNVIESLRQKHPLRAPAARRNRLGKLECLESRNVPASFIVNTSGDSFFGSGSGGAGDLRYCAFIASTNSDLVDTITFAANVSSVNLLGRVAVSQNSGGTIKIKGSVTISSAAGTGAFTVATGAAIPFTAVFEDLTISGCSLKAGNGAAILTQGAANVTLANSRLTGNSTLSGDGGGIAMTGTGNLVLDNSKVNSNIATRGGGIFNGGTGTVSVNIASQINSNQASFGGGIYSGTGSGAITLGQALVDGNQAIDGGGILNAGSATIQLSKCTVTNNTATGHGGGVSNESGGGITAVSTHFGSNTAGISGGGISNRAMGTIDLTKCSVLENIVTDHSYATTSGGGGIANLDAAGKLSIVDSAIGLNDGYAGGGVLSFGNLRVQSSSIWGNIGRNGGGLHIRGLNNEVLQCTISGNLATCGGGIYTSDSTVFKVYNSTIVYNHGVWDHGHAIGEGIWAERDTYMTLFSTIVADNDGSPNLINNSYNPVQMNYSLIEGNLFIGHTYTSTSGNNYDDFVDLVPVPYSMAGVPGVDPNGSGASGLPVPQLFSADPPTFMPVYEGGATENVNHALITDQRGLPFSRHVSDVDIGAYEHDIDVDGRRVRIRFVHLSVEAVIPPQISFIDVSAFNLTGVLDLATADSLDIVVAGPNRYRQPASFVGTFQGTQPGETILRYQFSPPGGKFDSADNGLYYASLQPNQLMTMDKVAIPAGLVQTILVEIATPIVVTNINDGGPGSLRDAVLMANGLQTSVGRIEFDPVFFATPRTIILTGDSLPVRNGLYLAGPGSAMLTIIASPNAGGQPHTRVFDIEGTPGMHVSISGISMSGASPDGNGGTIRIRGADIDIVDSILFGTGTAPKAINGGAISVEGDAMNSHTDQGSLSLSNVRITGFRASNDGGAIEALGNHVISIVGGTLSNNSAGRNGGAIAHVPMGVGFGGVTSIWPLYSTTISSNAAAADGGGIWLGGGVDAVVRNSTVSGNSASGGGGGLMLAPGSMAHVKNSTLAFNTAATGGGIASNNSTLMLISTVVGKNSATTGPDVSGTASVNNSLVSTTAGATISGASNVLNADPMLAPLANNGGPTQTHALLAGSPAINKGSNPDSLAVDQRGVGFARVVGGAPDIGAVEMQSTSTPAKVSAVVVNNGAAQRSRVSELKVTFNSTVTFAGAPALAFMLNRQTDGAVVTLNAAVDNTGLGTVVTLTFTGGPVIGAGLTDGRYNLTVLASQIAGAGLDGNSDGTAGDHFLLVGSTTAAPKLYRYFGDADGDGDVDNVDFGAFRAAFGQPGFSVFDLDGDGDVDNLDFAAFRSRFGAPLP